MNNPNDRSPATEPGSMKDVETATLIAAGRVSGTKVYDGQGEMLGVIHDIILDKRRGVVSYAVMSFGGFLGGFLGLGEKYHPLPWNLLTYDELRGGYVIDIDPKVIEHAPAYTEDSVWNAPNYGSEIDSFYSRPAGG